jgi:membrane protease subunit HflC
MNRLIILGVVVLAALYIVFSSVYVVNEREQAIVMRFGQITDIKDEPGIYFKIPTNVVDSVQIVEDRLLRYDIADMTVQVSGGKFYEVDAFLTYRISDATRFRQFAAGDLDVVDSRIDSRFTAALRQVYGLREFDAALSAERPAMMREARDLIRPDMEQLGIDIVDVRILRTDLTQDVSAQTFDRMKAERLAEAAFLRARGQEASQSLRAIADRQSVEIRAAAARDSEILRGEGDAQRNQIFADAYSRNPDFFEFYRSMQSYRTALGAQGTTMVLSPDSEFFQYFNAVGAGTAPTGSDAATAAPAIETPAGTTEPVPEVPTEPAAEAPSATGEPVPEVPTASTAAGGQ